MSGGGSGAGGGPRKPIAAEPGLCATCVHRQLVESPRSIFVRCRLADTDSRYPRYPSLPVLRCGGYRRLSE